MEALADCGLTGVRVLAGVGELESVRWSTAKEPTLVLRLCRHS